MGMPPVERSGSRSYLWFALGGVAALALMAGFRRAARYFRDKSKAAVAA